MMEADGTISVQTNALQEANGILYQDISNLETLLAQRITADDRQLYSGAYKSLENASTTTKSVQDASV